jgi:hypothetical protein
LKYKAANSGEQLRVSAKSALMATAVIALLNAEAMRLPCTDVNFARLDQLNFWLGGNSAKYRNMLDLAPWQRDAENTAARWPIVSFLSLSTSREGGDGLSA